MLAPKKPNTSGHHPHNHKIQEKKPFVLQRQGQNAGIQEKLKVGQPNDRFEKEADSVADTVVSKSETPKVEASTTPPIQTMKVGSGDLAQRMEGDVEPASPKPVERVETEAQLKEETDLDVQRESEEQVESESEVQLVEEEDVQLQEETTVDVEPVKTEAQLKTDSSPSLDVQLEAEIQTKSEPEPVQAKIEEAPVQKKEIKPEPPKPIIAPPVQMKTEMAPEEEVQMKEDEEKSDEAESVQLKSKAMDSGDDVSSQIASSKGGGSTMDDTIKSDMESGFGHDFSGVRIHTDSQSAQMNSSLGAKAFTTGNDIYFNEGEYRPDTKDGKHLLAHELTHTLQQGSGNSQIQKLDDPELILERKQLYKEVKTLWALTNRLQSNTGDNRYNLRNLQKAFFEDGTSFSGEIKENGGIPGLWPNLVLIYYLINRAWTTADPYPQVKSQVVQNKLIVLSEFEGQIIMAADVKGEFLGEGRNIQTITAYNHIAIKGLKSQADSGFCLVRTSEAFNAIITSNLESINTTISDYQGTGEARLMGYHIEESQFAEEYQILRENGYDKSLKEYRLNPISLRDHLEGGKDFKWIKKPGVVNNTEGVQLRKAPFTEKDVETLAESYKGPNDLKVKVLPFNTTFTAYRETTNPSQKWAYIKTTEGDRGYISMVYATLNLPHLGAKLHLVTDGETKSSIANEYRDWIINSDYILALEYFNSTIRGKKLTVGHTLWIPSTEKAKEYIMALPKFMRKTRTEDETVVDLTKELFDAIDGFKHDKVLKILRRSSVTPAIVQKANYKYYKKYSEKRMDRNLYADLMHFMDHNIEEYWETFDLITDSSFYKNTNKNLALNISGISGFAPVGSNFVVSIGTDTPVYRPLYGPGSRGPKAYEVIFKDPARTYPQGRYNGIHKVEIDDANKGTYDFIFLAYEGNSDIITPLRVKQVVSSSSVAGEKLMEEGQSTSFDDYMANLEFAKIQLGGFVTLEQGLDELPRIENNSYRKRNPSYTGDATAFNVIPSSSEVSYKWWARQINYGKFDPKGWPEIQDKLGNYNHISTKKEFGGNSYSSFGSGSSVGFIGGISGHRHILAEEIGANGEPTGKVAQYIQYELDGEAVSEYTWSANSEVTQYKGLEKAMKTGKDRINKYISGDSVPIKTGYINTESGTEMFIPLYIGKSKNKSKGEYVIVDLLPGVKDYFFYGDTVNEAISEFEGQNMYPTGHIFLEIEENSLNISTRSKSFETTGMSAWQLFTTTTGWLAIGAFISGAILELVPGGQAAGTVLIITAMTLGAATSVINIYDQMRNAEPDGGYIALEVMNLVGSLLAGGSKAISLLSKSSELGTLGRFVYYVGEGLDIADGVFLTVAGAERIKDILTSEMSKAEMKVELTKAIFSLVLGGYLLGNVSRPKGNSIFKRKANELIARYRKVEPKVTSELSDISGKQGGKMVGLEFKLKSAESLERKLASEGVDIPMNDVLRYTMIFDVNFTNNVLQVLEKLKSKGYQIVKIKNTFKTNVPYKGVNCQVKMATGEVFELQFHTSKSFDMKQNVNHELYEKYRLLDPLSPEAKEIKNKMTINSNSITIPKGVDKLK